MKRTTEQGTQTEKVLMARTNIPTTSPAAGEPAERPFPADLQQWIDSAPISEKNVWEDRFFAGSPEAKWAKENAFEMGNEEVRHADEILATNDERLKEEWAFLGETQALEEGKEGLFQVLIDESKRDGSVGSERWESPRVRNLEVLL